MVGGEQPAATRHTRLEPPHSRTHPRRRPPTQESTEVVVEEQPAAPSAITSSCVVCFDSGFDKGSFNDRTVLICDQCEREYHVSRA